jgi:hypothetical protein
MLGLHPVEIAPPLPSRGACRTSSALPLYLHAPNILVRPRAILRVSVIWPRSLAGLMFWPNLTPIRTQGIPSTPPRIG